MCFQMGKLGQTRLTEAAPGKGKWHASYVMLKKKMVEGKVWCSKQEIGGKLAHLWGFSLIGCVLLSRRSGVTDGWARADTCFWRSLIFKCSSCVNINTWGNQLVWRDWRVGLSVPISLSVSACLPLLCLSGVRYTVMFSRLIKNHKITMKKQSEVIFCLSVLSGWPLLSVSRSSVSLCFISLLWGVIHCLHLSLFFHSGPPSFSRFLSQSSGTGLRQKRAFLSFFSLFFFYDMPFVS